MLAVIPMRTQVVFPDTSVAFDAGRGVSLAAIERSEKDDRHIFIVKQKNSEKETPDEGDLYNVGTVARIRQITRLPGDRIRVYAEGLYRAVARSYRVENGYIYSVTDELKTVHADDNLEEAYFRTAKELVKDIVSGDGRISKDVEGYRCVCKRLRASSPHS